MAVLGLGLAALGRPGYLNIGHGNDLGPDRSVDALRARTRDVCDAAWEGGIRWFDAARSYGLAEEFLADWLRTRGIGPGDATVSSKWGYTYTAGWKVEAAVHEVKDHGAGALARQWPESNALVGPWLGLYQVHSATEESGVLEDRAVHHALAALPVRVGLSLSGPRQAATLRRALEVEVDGRQLFSAVQATWNVLEPSVGAALAEAKDAGWTVVVKEALANGRLAGASSPTAGFADAADATALAAVLVRPWADVVLSGASTAAQLRSNLEATDAARALDPTRFDACAIEPADYWSARSQLTWT